MQLARVMGTVVATRKEATLEGRRLMLVQPIQPHGEPRGHPIVAVDAVGAGEHEVVLFAQGSSARMTEISKDRPIDAVIMAIVDTLEIGGDVIYRKG